MAGHGRQSCKHAVFEVVEVCVPLQLRVERSGNLDEDTYEREPNA